MTEKEVPKTKLDAERKYALVLLIKAILSQVSEIAYLKAEGHSARLSEEILKEMTSVLTDLEPELQAAYYELLPKLAEKSAPRRESFSEDYVQSVAPAKKRFVQKIRQDLGAKAA